MANELKATVVNMKHLSQNIDDPVVVGAADANGRTLRVIFTQEAAAQFTASTKVYLSWHHQEKNIKGYNVFTEVVGDEDEDLPPTWEIHYPQSMLHEGNVLACIQLVDDVSIATSTNFMIHILADPNNGSDYGLSDDFSDLKKMIIRISCLEKQMKDQMESQKIEFEDMQLEFQQIRKIAMDAEQIAAEAKQIAEEANATAAEALETAESFPSFLEEVQEQLDNVKDISADAKQIAEEAKDTADEAKEIASQMRDFTGDIEAAKEEAKQYTDDALTIFEF